MSSSPSHAAFIRDNLEGWLHWISPETLAAYERIKADLQGRSADGLTLDDVGAVLHKAIDEAVLLLAPLELAGDVKKTAVMAIVAKLFDAAPVLPLPVWLVPLRPILRPLAKQLALFTASRTIEWIYLSRVK